LIALSRFISRLAERALPFFKLLRKSGPFVWTNDVDEALQELKRYLTSPPVMVAPKPGEPLLLYITATLEAVSMVLVAERPDPHAPHEPGAADGSGSLDLRPTEEGRELPGPAPMEMEAPDPPLVGRTVQRLVYFISEVLHEAKTRYLEVHKLLYAVLIASKKVRHYFQAHRISVVTSYPLRTILRNPNTTGNIAKWAAELAEFELNFVPHHAVKSQVLADFIVDWTPSASP
jgi:hypothetical protein